MVKIVLIFLCLSSVFLLHASDKIHTFQLIDNSEEDFLKNRRRKHPLGVNFGMLGPTGWGFASIDYFVDSKIDLEAGLGVGFQTNDLSPASMFLGAKYHVGAKFLGGITPYFGIMDAFFWSEGNFYQHNLYLPIGLHKIKRNKWSWAVEVAYQFNKYANQSVWGSFKVGYRIW